MVDIKQRTANTTNQALCSKVSSAMEIRAASASAKFRQSNRIDKRIELTMQLLHSSSGVGKLRPTCRIWPTAVFHPAHLCLPKPRLYFVRIYISVENIDTTNESLTKINAVIPHVLSASEYNVQNEPNIPQNHPCELFMSF